MFTYTLSTPGATRADQHPSRSTKRAKFAGGLALDANPRSRWVFQDPDFQDRAPDQQPRRLDHVAAEVVGNVGQAALDHWIREAAGTTGEAHEVALQIACEIAEMIGVPWAEVMSGEAA